MRTTIFVSAVALVFVACGSEQAPTNHDGAITDETAPPETSVPTGLRIVCVGDSLTQGETGYDSYRRELYLQLTGRGQAVDFMGSQRGPGDDFDDDHEGHAGVSAAAVAQGLPAWITTYDTAPSVAIVLVGIEDVIAGTEIATTTTAVESIVGSLRDARPGVTVLVGEVPGARDLQARVDALDTAFADTVATLSTAASPVVLVEQRAGFDAATMTYDGVHPNSDGESYIAQGFFLALGPYLGR